MIKKKASLVIMVVWMLTMFTILGVGLYRITASNISLSARIRDNVLTRHLAKGASRYMQAKLKNDETDFDTLYEWRQEITKDFKNGSLRFNAIDQESKININRVSIDELELLPGLDQDLAENIYEYENKPFKTTEELLLVEDITPDIYREVKEYITVYGKGRVNINTANQVSLQSLGLDQDLINIIKSYRAGPDGQEVTEDDRSFENRATILSTLGGYTTLFTEQENKLKSVISKGYLGVSSQAYSVSVKTEFYGQKNDYNIIITKERMLRWKESDYGQEE